MVKITKTKTNNKQADQAQKKLSVLRKALESYPFVSELKGLMAEYSTSENWQQMLPPFTPLLESEIRELSAEIKNNGLDLNQRLWKISLLKLPPLAKFFKILLC